VVARAPRDTVGMKSTRTSGGSAEPVEPPEDWTGPLDNLETDDPDEFGAGTDTQPEDCFRDDREPWESLLAAEAMGIDSEDGAIAGRVRDAFVARVLAEFTVGFRGALRLCGSRLTCCARRGRAREWATHAPYLRRVAGLSPDKVAPIANWLLKGVDGRSSRQTKHARRKSYATVRWTRTCKNTQEDPPAFLRCHDSAPRAPLKNLARWQRVPSCATQRS
jgi:hypothetical protein